MKLKKALLIVDMQNDFCPGGALGIKDGDKIISAINKYIKIFSEKKLPIFASRDWHPKKTQHFKEFGGVWPRHCIQNTRGAKFHPKLELPKEAILLSKGMDPERESYSVFHGVGKYKPFLTTENHLKVIAKRFSWAQEQNGMSFLNLLKTLGVEEIYMGGLATDYCVKFSAIDALKERFKVKLLVDAIKGVNLKPEDSESAIREMVRGGAKKITLGELSKADGKES